MVRPFYDLAYLVLYPVTANNDPEEIEMQEGKRVKGGISDTSDISERPDSPVGQDPVEEDTENYKYWYVGPEVALVFLSKQVNKVAAKGYECDGPIDTVVRESRKGLGGGTIYKHEYVQRMRKPVSESRPMEAVTD